MVEKRFADGDLWQTKAYHPNIAVASGPAATLTGTAIMSLHRARRTFLEQQEQAPPLNWRRGFFRIWLLVSAAWIMGWAIYLALHAIQGEFTRFVDLLVILVVFFGPPIALFLCGLGVAWAFRGFVAEEGPPAE